MADWEDEDFEPPTIDKPVAPATDLWEGEDEEDDIKDNWDDEEEEKKPETPNQAAAAGEPKKSTKKALSKKLKEKEEQAARAAEAKRLAALAEKTPEEIMADKLMAQKLSEESDFEVAKDTFGVTSADLITIDNCDPRTKEDFINFEKLISEKFSKYESSPHYQSFLETLFRNSCLSLDAESLKKLISSLNVLQSEKAKQERQKKGGKKTNKAKLTGGTKGGGKDEFIDYSAYDEMEDFM
ncbi:eukaryotic translation initiation factor 3 subunit J-like isoform X1 [Styela clava]